MCQRDVSTRFHVGFDTCAFGEGHRLADCRERADLASPAAQTAPHRQVQALGYHEGLASEVQLLQVSQFGCMAGTSYMSDLSGYIYRHIHCY